MEISNYTIKVSYRFFCDKMDIFNKMNERLFENTYTLEPYNIFLEILYYYLSPSESIDLGDDVNVFCEYDSYSEFENGKVLAELLEKFLYKELDRIVDFLKLYGENPPTLNQIKTFKKNLIEQFEKEISNES